MVGGAAPHGRPQITQDGHHVRRAGECGKTRAWGKREILGGLRSRGSSGVWHHGGLEHRRARPLRLVQHSMGNGLWVNSGVGEGKKRLP